MLRMRRGPRRLVFLLLLAGCARPVRHATPANTTEVTVEETAPPKAGAAPAPSEAAPETPPTPPDPSSRAGIVCDGDQEMRLEGKVVDASGTAVTASGQCRLTIVKSTLRGGDVGVRASGTAHVVVEDSTVGGGRRAISASGDATIETRHTTWNGGIEAADHARVIDQGDNTWSR
jgi:hypothetical protein